MYTAPMQLTIKFSKYLIFVVLSCSLLIALHTSNLDITASNFTFTDVSEMVESDSNIWSSISNQFQLDHKTQNAQVQAEIRELLADQQKLYQILQAAAPYIYFIHQKAQEKGLPGELALIPVIESEFNPNDHSSKKGATGLWQLMSGTANELGVKVKTGYDGRKNVVSSTNAALAYFKDLGNDFKGDWYLAIAAYNCGQGRVASAERKSGLHNFWNLPLPHETRCYVPKLLAVAAIIANPKKYGVELPPIDNKPYFRQVKVLKPIDLAKLASTSGVDINELRVLNPDYAHGNVPKSKDGAYSLLVPLENASAIEDQLQKSNTIVVA
ncbi:MAG TPA: transglycosylase SLT domain-containing protein [Gammaproteobacteria bacterium]|nr:transglycosylase SLT domain-containing protein [Gammaproteobacteria bacterium]